MPWPFKSRNKKIKTLTTTVYSLAAVDKETYLLLQCTVNVTEKVSKKILKVGFSSKHQSNPDISKSSPRKTAKSLLPALSVAATSSGCSLPSLQTAYGRIEEETKEKVQFLKRQPNTDVSMSSPRKIPRLSVHSSSLASTSSSHSQLSPQTTSGRVEKETEEEDSSETELKSEDQLWKPITTMNVPPKFDRSEKPCITGDRDSGLLKELSKKHFQNQAMIRQSAKSSRESTDDEGASTTFQAQGASTSQAQESPGQILSNGIMSVAYLNNYLYAIGIVIGGEATELVRRIEVFRKDNIEPAYVWEEVPSLPGPCPYHASHTMINCGEFDAIFVIGGDSLSTRLLELCFCDDGTNRMDVWDEDNTRGDIGLTRMMHCLLAIPAGVYVIGGIDRDGSPVLFSDKSPDLQEYNVNCHWQLVSPLNQPKACFVALAHGYNLYAIGGCHTAKYSNTPEGTVTMETCRPSKVTSESWRTLNGFQTDSHCLLGFVLKETICILGGKPKTFDLRSSDDVYSITWNLSPTIDLPTIYFENTASTVAQVKTTVRQLR